jgi:glutaconate CoA-transferase subunit B
MNCTPEELLIGAAADLLEGAGHVAVGSLSPIPAAGALLARARSGKRMRVSLLGSAEHNFFTEGGRELFDCAAQGRIDAFFLGGAQIDGAANINLVGIGAYPQSEVRLAGSFGSSYLYFLVPRVILFKPEHTRRTLVERADFVSAPGTSPPGTYRPGGPVALLTGRCVFGFDRDAACFRLSTRHPDQSLQEISGNTAFEYETPEDVPITREPDAETLSLIRGDVRHELAGTYPRFAAQVLAHQFR